MPTSDEIRQNISKSAENFKQTVNSFNGNWTEAPDDENWSAQQVAEHTVKAIIFFARGVKLTPSSSNNKCRFCSARKKPGAIAFTRILGPYFCAKCVAKNAVKFCNAAFAAEYPQTFVIVD